MREAIVIEDLSKYYGGLLALDKLSLRINRDENVALLGPNGAGKTTTLKILCGLLRPSSGAAYIDDIDVMKDREKAIAKVGAILETPEFYPFFTPEEILTYLGRLRGMDGHMLKRRIKDVIGLVRLDDWVRVKVGKFSRGMKQRLAVAQALLHDPLILILDEPALGLDPRGMMEIREILKKVRKEKTVFLASHLLTEVAQICDKVAIIESGRLRAYEGIVTLKRKYRSFERAYLRLTEATI